MVVLTSSPRLKPGGFPNLAVRRFAESLSLLRLSVSAGFTDLISAGKAKLPVHGSTEGLRRFLCLRKRPTLTFVLCDSDSLGICEQSPKHGFPVEGDSTLLEDICCPVHVSIHQTPVSTPVETTLDASATEYVFLFV